MSTVLPFSMSSGALENVVAALKAAYGERVNCSAVVRGQHARGEGLSVTLPPDVVVWPSSHLARAVR
jgi:hypothetical protein